MTVTGQHPLLAVVVRGGHVPFSRRPAPLVAVLSGRIAPGEDVQLVGRARAPISAKVHSVGHGGATPADEDRIVSLDGVAADDIAVGDLLRHPGETLPALSVPGPSAPARALLLDAVRWARLGPVDGPDAETIALLPDEAVVLHVERRLRRALGRHTSPFALKDDFEAAASALETVGLRTDADRLRVTAAAALEGIGVSPSNETLTHAAEIGTLTATDASDRVTGQAKGIGALFDLDILEGLASGYQGACVGAGEQLRRSLVAEDRAIALGWCRKCRAVTRLDDELRCPLHAKKGQDVVLSVPADAAMTQAWLTARAGAHR